MIRKCKTLRQTRPSSGIILEKAPWWGGYYESMVKLVQRSLRKVLGNAKLTYEDLLTVVTEVEGVLNSRPITNIYTDVIEEPLNLSHLVIGRRIASLPDSCQLTDEHDCATTFQRRARHLNQFLEHFWRRWSKEYLVNLREFHRLRTGTETKKARIGDVVVIQDDGLPRGSWRKGVIQEQLPSRDGEIRGAILRATTRRGKPVQPKLFPLEVSARTQKRRGKLPRKRMTMWTTLPLDLPDEQQQWKQTQ